MHQSVFNKLNFNAPEEATGWQLQSCLNVVLSLHTTMGFKGRLFPLLIIRYGNERKAATVLVLRLNHLARLPEVEHHLEASQNILQLLRKIIC